MDDVVGRYTYPGRIFPVSRSASRSADDNRRRPAYSPRYCVDNVSRICSTLSPLINHDFPVNSRKKITPVRGVIFCGGGGGIRTPGGVNPNGFQDRLVMTASIRLRVFYFIYYPLLKRICQLLSQKSVEYFVIRGFGLLGEGVFWYSGCRSLVMKCFLCPNMCGVDRNVEEGLCHADNDMRICRIAPHFYEEPPISGTRGSGTVFFSGCSMDCLFCQNYEISKAKVGKVFSPPLLAEELKKLVSCGVHNINFVTPTHFSHKIKETLDIYRPPVPIVYNTSGFERKEVVQSLLPYVDIFLTDIKYASSDLGQKYSSRKNYFENCLEATEVMVKEKPLLFDSDGLLKQGVIVRHLVLPTEIENSLNVIDLFADRWRDKAIFSLMSQFFPSYRSPINRTLKPVDTKPSLNRLIERGIKDCFVQELSSATEFYVPSFDTTL